MQIQNINGSYSYSDIRTINPGGNTNGFTFFPREPSERGKVNFDLPIPHNSVILMIYDNNGKSKKEQPPIVNTTVELPVSKGIYIMQVSDKDGGNVVRRKLVVQ